MIWPDTWWNTYTMYDMVRCDRSYPCVERQEIHSFIKRDIGCEGNLSWAVFFVVVKQRRIAPAIPFWGNVKSSYLQPFWRSQNTRKRRVAMRRAIARPPGNVALCTHHKTESKNTSVSLPIKTNLASNNLVIGNETDASPPKAASWNQVAKRLSLA